MAADSHPDRLSSDEVASVLRRAADLEAQAAGRAGVDEGFDAAAVEEAALEVGLSPAAVRQAMVELHTGELSTGRRRGRGLSRGRAAVPRTSPSIVQVARLVPCAPAVVHTSAEQYLRTQTFEIRRRQEQVVLYRQRRDLGASLRRGFDLHGAIQLEGVAALTMTVTPLASPDNGDPGGRCMVRMVAELRGRATMNVLANLIGLSAAGMAVVPGVIVGGVGWALGAAVFTGTGVTLGGLAVGHSWWHRRREQVAEVLDGFLDSLESRQALGS